MREPQLEPNKSALVIVAHPDDETIWMGGFILQHPRVRWTIFSLCRASDADRAPKFRRVCELYSAESIITDLEDEDKMTVEQTIPIVKKLITEKVGSRRFDYLFTHGVNGEYGHPRHVGVYQAVAGLIKDRILPANRVFYFNYEKTEQGESPAMRVKDDSDYIFRLTEAEFREKKRVVAEMYGYPIAGIDVGYCVNPEGFKLFTQHIARNTQHETWNI